ncbi:MAG: diguanylate cyclase [Burkholderiaceae bacterium]|nr:diguanylate cyclase [Burkholderiaceae bacterium]
MWTTPTWVIHVVATLCVAATLDGFPFIAQAQTAPDTLLNRVYEELPRGSESAKVTFDQIAKIEPTLSQAQRFRYLKLLSVFYGLQDMAAEEVATSRKALQYAANENQRAGLLYFLVDGYSRLGEYENALRAMNEGVLLLPKLTELQPKAEILQSAIALYESLHAYDEAGVFAQRMIDLPDGDTKSACMGMADQIEITYLQHDGSRLRALRQQAIKICNDRGFKIIALNIQALDTIDRLRSNGGTNALKESLLLLNGLTQASARSDYNTQLAEAIAKSYLSFHQPALAEPYANHAWQWAKEGNSLQLQQQTSETMAAVLRAQGKLAEALNYLDISHTLWEKLLEERSRKDLAYERVKFEQQDQADQIKLLTQINQLLTSERDLEKRNKHSLWLVLLLALMLLGGALAWLVQTRRQRNQYRTSAQIDSLTEISNRSHFVDGALATFKDTRRSVAVVLFDMDHFKQINDNYSHAIGDWTLKAVSATIKECLRAHDMFGRLGGEEFAICLPNTEEREALALAERCRSAIEAIDSSDSGLHFDITASFGVAVRPALGSACFEDTLAAADHALYRAKRLGRNRVVAHQESTLVTNEEQVA